MRPRRSTATPAPQSCPTYQNALTLQGGYNRLLRHNNRIERLWVWHGFCTPCRRSHALVPDFVIPHHLDTTNVIFAALDRRIIIDVPTSTRRGCQTRFTRNTPTLTSACATATVTFGGRVDDMHVDRLLAALSVAARPISDMIPSPRPILNIISGGSWVRDRVNSSWPPFGAFPRPP